MSESSQATFLESPFTGNRIPLTLKANMHWRSTCFKRAESAATHRRSLTNLFENDPVYWTCMAGWTYHQKWVDGKGEEKAVTGPQAWVPFILFPVQAEAIKTLHDCILEGRDALIRKSRDMGASWIVCALFQWFWMYRPNTTFLHLSRKKDLVDRKGDMDSLFEKHRAMLRWLPDWMRPAKIRDRHMLIENVANGSVISGEATTGSAGQAARKTAIHCDEFARFDRIPGTGKAVDISTADTTACRIFNSTPDGPHTHFKTIRMAFERQQRTGTVVTLPWWEHPVKGRDAQKQWDGDRRIERWTNAWYRLQRERRSTKDVAMNLDMDDDTSGGLFFDINEIDKHKREWCRSPLFTGLLSVPDDVSDERRRQFLREKDRRSVKWTQMPDASWRFWVPLVYDELEKVERPDQTAKYIFGVDVSGGTGASNSVCSVYNCNTRMIVAKFWDSYHFPERFADLVAFAGLWFGGRNRWPFVVYERNGPGGIFGRRIATLGYPNLYQAYIEDWKTRKKTRRIGWHSDKDTKPLLLGEYRQAIKNGTIINPCEESLEEAAIYTVNDQGKLEAPSTTEEDDGAMEAHGDHVIADALCVHGAKHIGSERIAALNMPGTFAFRQRQSQQERRQRSRDSDPEDAMMV